MLDATPKLSLEELALFNELFASKFGLFFPEHKLEILQNRLAPRLRACHLHRFLDYYLLLQYDLARELDPLIQAITNNESYFFRETGQFQALDAVVLDELRRGGVPGRLRFLSAGCSSGEEPYTLNIFLRRQAGLGKHEIDAFDIDAERLEMARRAVYRTTSLRALDADQVGRYFERHDPHTFQLRSVFRDGVRFDRGNILELGGPGRDGAYDGVFCRNVLIYFSEPALKGAIESFARVVRPGGLLFLGHSESIIGLTKKFRAERLGNCIAYRRTDE